MALEVVPASKDKVNIDLEKFVFACVSAMQMKRLYISNLLRDPRALSGVFIVISHQLGLKLNKQEAKEQLGLFWNQNEAKLVPLIAERMGSSVPESFADLTKSKQRGLAASEPTEDEKARQMSQNSFLDAENVTKTSADNSTQGRHEAMPETNQNRSDNVAEIITRNEFEATIQNLRTEINTELERRQKVSEDWQFWARKQIEFMTERIQKLSEYIPDFNHHDDYELSPEPARAGKSHLIKKSKIWGTLDTELEYLLKKEAERKGVTFSRILDSAVWNFLKKPPLSFQKKKRDDQN